MTISIALCLVLASPPDSIPYNLAQPSAVVVLKQPELQEISGLGTTETPGIFCAISDEVGEIYFLDTSGNIVRRLPFRDKGDFEGVEWTGRCLYAVKSDGTLFELFPKKTGLGKVNSYATPLTKQDDIEGLGYDPARHALLIACKGNPDDSAPRRIFAFDLKTLKLSDQPVYVIDPLRVDQLLPEPTKKHFFSPSAIALHPKTRDVYVLSSSLRRLVVLDYHSGAIRWAVRLEKKVFPQPEGLTFSADGTLYISSEAKDGEARLLRFDPKK